MNKIAFKVQPSRHCDHRAEVCIEIDDIDLIELVRKVELPFATAEGNPSLAGKYAGLEARFLLLPSRHLLGDPDPYLTIGPRAQLLGCEGCYEPGCWPLVCRIEVGADTVRWSDFQQYYRSGLKQRMANKGIWSYDLLGPFEFDRGQYEEALRAPMRGAA